MEYKKAAEFAAENLKTIYAYSLSRVSNKAEAEELASDIVLNILESAPKIRNDEAFFGYVWAIAANTYKKYLRKKKRAADNTEEAELDSVPDDCDFTEDIERREEIFALRRELSLLSKGYRECTVAYYMDSLSCAEISRKYSISVDMVKYYLFKTRKILKEGIAMEREYGVKSYKPAKFEFITIFSGQYNPEYRNMFNRRLPGNILLSAYYTPMTVRELSVELGVASAYMEDEIALLEKYKLITPLPGGKYQTNLLVLTKDSEDEFIRRALFTTEDYLSRAVKIMRESLDCIRKIGFIGSKNSENRLMWSLFYMLPHYGFQRYREKFCITDDGRDEIYRGATGINYGVDYEPRQDKYSCSAFAGEAGADSEYSASFANFGVLPEKNHVDFNNVLRDIISQIKSDPENAVVAAVDENQKHEILKLLSPALDIMCDLYDFLCNTFTDVVKDQAPKSVHKTAERIVRHLIYHRTVGLVGAAAVDSGELPMPDFDTPAALYFFKK